MGDNGVAGGLSGGVAGVMSAGVGSHRKTVRHYDLPGHAHELTFSCYQRWPLLCGSERLQLLSRSIDRAVALHRFRLLAFVFMPEHVHLIVFAGAESGASRDFSGPVQLDAVEGLLYAIKRPFSYRVKQILAEQEEPLLDRLTIRERPGRMAFRFWQEGPGYDRNIRSLDALNTAIEYVHRNPVRRGLCGSAGEWKWSSWKSYYDPEHVGDPDLPSVQRGVW